MIEMAFFTEDGLIQVEQAADMSIVSSDAGDEFADIHNRSQFQAEAELEPHPIALQRIAAPGF